MIIVCIVLYSLYSFSESTLTRDNLLNTFLKTPPQLYRLYSKNIV